MITLELEGFKLVLEITGWKPSNRDNWDSTWCKVKMDLSSSFMEYNINSECLLSCEVEELKESLDKIIDGENAKNVSCIEPDFEFEFSPATDKKDNQLMDLIISFWDQGVLTANSLRLCLDKDDMIILRDYLQLVISGETG